MLGIDKDTAELLQTYMGSAKRIKEEESEEVELGDAPERLRALLNYKAAVQYGSEMFPYTSSDAWYRLYKTINQYLRDTTDIPQDTRSALVALLQIAQGIDYPLPKQFERLLADAFLTVPDESSAVGKAAMELQDCLTKSLVEYAQRLITEMVATPVTGFSASTRKELAAGKIPPSLAIAIRDLGHGATPYEIGMATMLPDDPNVLARMIREGDGVFLSLAPLLATVAPPHPEVIDACAASKDSAMPSWSRAWLDPWWLSPKPQSKGKKQQGNKEEPLRGAQDAGTLWDHIQRCITNRDWDGLSACFGVKQGSQQEIIPVPNMVAGAALAYRRAIDAGAIDPHEARERLLGLIGTVTRVALTHPEPSIGAGDDADAPDKEPVMFYIEPHLRDILPGLVIPWPGDPDEVRDGDSAIRMEEHLRAILEYEAECAHCAKPGTTINYLGLAPLLLANPWLLDEYAYPETEAGQRAYALARDCLRYVLSGPPDLRVQHVLSPITAATTVALLNYFGVARIEDGIPTRGRIFSGISFQHRLIEDKETDKKTIVSWWKASRESVQVERLPTGLDLTGSTIACVSIDTPMVRLRAPDSNLVGCDIGDIEQSDFSDAWFEQVNAPKRRIRDTQLTGAVVADGDLSGTTLTNVAGRHMLWYEGDRRGIVINESNLDDSAYVGGDWSRAQFRKTSMRRTIAIRTTFADTVWNGTTIEDAQMQRCIFNRADLSQVIGLETADVSGSSFEMTKLPRNLRGWTIATQEVQHSIPSRSGPPTTSSMTVSMVIGDPDTITDDIVQMAQTFPIDRYRRLCEQGRVSAVVRPTDPDYDEVMRLHEQIVRMSSSVKIYTDAYSGLIPAIASIPGTQEFLPETQQDSQGKQDAQSAWGKVVYTDTYYQMIDMMRQLIVRYGEQRKRGRNQSIPEQMRQRFLGRLIDATNRRFAVIRGSESHESGHNPWAWAHIDALSQLFFNGDGPNGLVRTTPPFISALPGKTNLGEKGGEEEKEEPVTISHKNIDRLTSALFTPRPSEKSSEKSS
jgi:uncharacterized protein YjbI with pentapeptide repeats